jgi:hypothetical protein
MKCTYSQGVDGLAGYLYLWRVNIKKFTHWRFKRWIDFKSGRGLMAVALFVLASHDTNSKFISFIRIQKATHKLFSSQANQYTRIHIYRRPLVLFPARPSLTCPNGFLPAICFLNPPSLPPRPLLFRGFFSSNAALPPASSSSNSIS